MGINLRFLCNSLSCFPVFLVITFHKDPHIIISVVVVVVPALAAAAAADDDDNNNNNDGICEGSILLPRIPMGT
jgi:hypothetical protein